MSVYRRFLKCIELLRFLRRHPTTSIVGGPRLLLLLGDRYESLPRGLYSQVGQDTYVLSRFFKKIIGERGFPKTFVDVGCNHPAQHSNSYFFERCLGFRVLAIDALSTHKKAWEDIRPTAELVITAVGRERGVVEFEELDSDGAAVDMFSSVKGASRKATEARRHNRTVSVVSLVELLRERDIGSIGILSIDIEGYEFEALDGLDLDTNRPRIVVVENNSESVFGDERIRDLMKSKRYDFVARVWGMDDIYVHRD